MKRYIKRLSALVLALVVLLSISAVSLAAEGLSVSLGQGSGKAGETVTLPISLNNNPGISGMSLTLSYDHAVLSFVKAENLTDGSFSPNTSSDVITWLYGHNKYEDGDYFSLSFAIKSDAAKGTYPITLSLTDNTGDNLVNENATPIPAALVAGSITVIGDEPGPGPGPGPDEPIVGPAVPADDSDIIVTAVRPGVHINGEGKRNPDGSIDITVWNDSGKVVSSVPGGVRVIVPHAGDGQVVVQLNEAGEIIDLVEKSLVEDGTAYTLLPGTAKIKIIDNAKPFRDVAEADWFNEFVIFVSSHELFIGVEDDLFAPRMDMTRAMMVTVLWRLEDRPEASGTASFRDVKRGSWYAAAVDWAAENGIALGYSDEVFAPGVNVTREQMAAFFYRYLKDLGFDVSASADFSAFADGSEVSSWAETAMHWAVGSGLIIGRSNTELAPRETATRAEVATMYKRLVTMMVKP